VALALYYQGVNMKWIDKYFNNPLSEVANAIETIELIKEQRLQQAKKLITESKSSRNKFFFNNIDRRK